MTITLRYLQTLTEIASEKNSTIIFPLPIELLNLLDGRAQGTRTACPKSRHDLADDGFHEIQLSGKQLVFLFMATTAARRGDLPVRRPGRPQRQGQPRRRRRNRSTASAVAAAGVGHAAAPPSGAAGRPPPPSLLHRRSEPDDELSYAKRLQADISRPEAKSRSLRTAEAERGRRTARLRPPPPRPVRPPPQAAPAGGTRPAPPETTAAAGRCAVRRAARRRGSCSSSALKDRSGRQRLAQRLSAKGYPAFVVDPAPGAPSIYRVQVGGYNDRAKPSRSRGGSKKKSSSSPGFVALAAARLRRSPRAELSEIRPSRVRLDRARAAAGRAGATPAAALRARASRSASSTGARLLRRHALLARRDDDDVRRAVDAAGGRSPRRCSSPISRCFPRSSP